MKYEVEVKDADSGVRAAGPSSDESPIPIPNEGEEVVLPEAPGDGRYKVLNRVFTYEAAKVTVVLEVSRARP